ncbi:Imm63 family immunity protein [Photorhabdus tasmaniensis]|uniref:Immunity protein 63 domain-containing protein n=1 Tax=Photorhabdus tasmaniensis TaxID=1004159 RepID=A0ABX0GJY5_9GAMM|nr:Imm63 family immunity protein [Photorhabdus tasmaniensis]NHB88475.1 hypothetical protein [Photorhabdus tasmaniensis]
MPTIAADPPSEKLHLLVESANQYHIIYSERGYEIFRQTTEDLNELLYWVMESVAK